MKYVKREDVRKSLDGVLRLWNFDENITYTENQVKVMKSGDKQVTVVETEAETYREVDTLEENLQRAIKEALINEIVLGLVPKENAPIQVRRVTVDGEELGRIQPNADALTVLLKLSDMIDKGKAVLI